MGNVDLFDAHNRLCFPTEAAIASMPKEAQARFKDVRKAKTKLDAATDHRKSVEQRIKDNDAERVTTKEAMDKLRPRWTAIDNVKAHIASEQAQRRRERGLQ